MSSDATGRDLLRIDAIRLGERVRKDLGDLQGLAASMREQGLLHPVVVTRDRTLICGHRRLEAARLLGWEEVPVTVIDVPDLLKAERDENECRKNFTPTEAVAIGRLIEEHERVKAQERIKAGKAPSGKLPEGQGQTRDVVARAVGLSGSTYERARQVVEAAQEDPARFGDLPARMDETGKVNGAYTEMRRREEAEGKPRARPKPDPEEPFVIATKRAALLAEAQKRRMVDSLSAIGGSCYVLERLDMAKIRAACTPEDITTWSDKAREAAKVLRQFSASLKGDTA